MEIHINEMRTISDFLNKTLGFMLEETGNPYANLQATMPI
jgi:hypothetical protein